MKITRRDFLKLCGISAATIGLDAGDLFRLEEVLANPNGPTVVWLQGTGCTGCSVSLLNRVSDSPPHTVADVLIDSINLTYHPNLMALAGDSAVAMAEKAYVKGGHITVVEGGVPTHFGGNTCWPWTYKGEHVTFQDAVIDLTQNAAKILCVGTCASWGGMAAAPPNPTGVKGVKAITGKTTINIPGCPAHPDWVVWAVAQLLLGNTVELDSYGRPKALFNRTVHSQCPRREAEEAETFGIDRLCLEELGCKGPDTIANCPVHLWNAGFNPVTNRAEGANWCCDANAPCIGCTDPKFPFAQLTSRGEDDD